MAVECLVKSGPYCCHVSYGVLASAPLTGKNISDGLRIAWYAQLTADQATRMTTAPTRIWTTNGAACNALNARRRDRTKGRTAVTLSRRTRVLRGEGLARRQWDLTAMCLLCLSKGLQQNGGHRRRKSGQATLVWVISESEREAC